MIKSVLGLVFNRWVLAAVLLLAISLVVWWLGPLIGFTMRSTGATWAPLESERARWITIGAIVALFALVIAWRAWRARRGNAAVVQQLMATPAARRSARAPTWSRCGSASSARSSPSSAPASARAASLPAGRPSSTAAISTSCRGT
jgi:type VI protein secretion system component VasK